MSFSCEITINGFKSDQTLTDGSEFVIAKNEHVVVTILIDLNKEKRDFDWKFNLVDRSAKLEVLVKSQLNNNSNLKGNLTINHTAAGSTAHCTFLTSADNASRVDITGSINIQKNCPHVSSRLSMKGLLLDSKSSIKQQPLLHIQTPNVQCSHGSTISSIPASQREYLQTRGLLPQTYKRVYQQAFLQNDFR